ncbi:hypothetical protein GF402_11940 [Candidatus Fermentibacteria bacterium]|nr:hypothetical protein [Candidatus Fermentibacteria bacterium]
MDEERRKILEMIADGKVTADEGARLLSALETGRSRERKEAKRFTKSRRRRKIVDMEALGTALSDIGPTVREAIENAFSGFRSTDIDPFDDTDLDFEIMVDEGLDSADPIEVAEGAVIDFRTAGRKGGNLELEGYDGDKLEVSGNHSGLRIGGSSEHLGVSWTGGNLKAMVPDHAETIRIRVSGGGAVLRRIRSDVFSKNMGGNLDIEDLEGTFQSKLMGGNLSVVLAEGSIGESEAKIMGGRVTLSVPESLPVEIDAATLGGKIVIDESLGKADTKGSGSMARATVLTGDDEARAKIQLKVVGGNVEVVSDAKD